MVEAGAQPRLAKSARTALRIAKTLTTPLVPDDYLELINPLWTWRELKGEIVEVNRETANASTVVIRPSARWPRHRAGQYLRIGVEIDGVRHWRNYTLTSDPDHPGGLISITVKRVDGGKLSTWFVDRCEPGSYVFLGDAEGTFQLPDPTPERVLLITAGSGITPVWSLLRNLAQQDRLHDVVHVHGCHDPDDFIFGAHLLRENDRPSGYRLVPWYRSDRDRLSPADLDAICPDWKERATFLSGPEAMIDTFLVHWNEHADPDLLHLERFQPHIGGDATVGAGQGGSIRFRVQGVVGSSDGRTPILAAGEEAGAELPYGCRIGVCHTCKCTLVHGFVRDLRTGEVHGEDGAMIRTCVNAPEGDIEVDEGHVVIKGTNARSER
ncbi:MAG: ferredoxin reductase [Pseudonocardiaceae bacterium]